MLTGELNYIKSPSGKVVGKEIDERALKRNLSRLLRAYKRSDSIQYYSDYGAALVYLGDYEKAKKVYEEIEEHTPNLYTTASNLGTIYELIGKPDSALIWIKKSVELNRKSHNGSEWIHIRILEHKLAKNPDINTSILGLDFGDQEKPSNPDRHDLVQIRSDIMHQLQERLTFIKPQNEIIGNIYFDLGNIHAQTTYLENALASYDEAKTFGFKSPLMELRYEAFMRLIKEVNPESLEPDYDEFILKYIFILFPLGIVGIIAIVQIRKRARRA